MTVQNMTALLGLNDNPDIKEQCNLVVKDNICEVSVPATVTDEMVELNELDID